MTTERDAYKIDEKHPGSDLAGETAAALAASSIVFRGANPYYSNILLQHAKEVSLLRVSLAKEHYQMIK